MQRLCTESACSYSGRSVWSGDASLTYRARRVCWLNKAQALREAVDRGERMRQLASRRVKRAAEQSAALPHRSQQRP